MPGPRSWGPRHQSCYRPWASVNPSVTPPPNTQMSRLGGAVPDCHIIAPEPASWALGMAGAPLELWKKAWEGGDGAPEQPSLLPQEADMPDEVNIDELLELDSEEDRRRKIQVGAGESCPPVLHLAPPCHSCHGYHVY